MVCGALVPHYYLIAHHYIYVMYSFHILNPSTFPIPFILFYPIHSAILVIFLPSKQLLPSPSPLPAAFLPRDRWRDSIRPARPQITKIPPSHIAQSIHPFIHCFKTPPFTSPTIGPSSSSSSSIISYYSLPYETPNKRKSNYSISIHNFPFPHELNFSIQLKMYMLSWIHAVNHARMFESVAVCTIKDFGQLNRVITN